MLCVIIYYIILLMQENLYFISVHSFNITTLFKIEISQETFVLNSKLKILNSMNSKAM